MYRRDSWLKTFASRPSCHQISEVLRLALMVAGVINVHVRRVRSKLSLDVRWAGNA